MIETLAEKTCTPCRGGVPPLPHDEAQRLQVQGPNWELADDAHRIERTLRFRNFPESLAFVRKTARSPRPKAITPTSRSAGATQPSR